MLTLARLLYRPTLALWCAWSRVYRRIWHHRYRHLAVWSNADLPTVARVLRTLEWRADGPRELLDACGSAQWVQHCVEEVAAGRQQPTARPLDCDDAAVWAATALADRYLARMLTVAWLDGWRVRGHVVAVADCSFASGGFTVLDHAGARWRQSAAGVVASIPPAGASIIAWAELTPGMRVLRWGRSLPRG